MTVGSYAREVIGARDVTFAHVWIVGAFLLFGVVALAYNIWRYRRVGQGEVKLGCGIAVTFTMYISITGYVFAWVLVHAMRNT